MEFNLGRVAPKPRKAWSASVADYKYLDIVKYDGGSYMVNIATGSVPAGALPTNTAYFDSLTERGLQGLQGVQGVPGQGFAGSFATVADANLAIKNEVGGDGKNNRDGKIVNIGTAGNYVQYTWKGGFTDADLIEVDRAEWTARAFKAGTKRTYLAKEWVANTNTLETDIPGTSPKWTDSLLGYNPITGSTFDFANEDLIQWYGINYTTGAIVPSEFADITDVIPVSKAVSITISGRVNSQKGIVFYDGFGTLIKPVGEAQFSTTNENGTFAIPSGAVGCRIATVFNLPLKVVVNIRKTTGKINSILGLTVGDVYKENLKKLPSATAISKYQLSDYTPSTGIDYSTGEQVTFTGSSISPLIPCLGFKSVIVSDRTSTIRGMVFYDASLNKIRPLNEVQYANSAASGTYEIPENAVSFKIAASNNSFNISVKLTGEIADTSSMKLLSINGMDIPYPSIKLTELATIYDKSKDRVGGIDYNTGLFVPQSQGSLLRASDLIPVEGNHFYQISGRLNSDSQGFAGYDKDRNPLPRSLFTGSTAAGKYGDTLNGTFFTANDVKYVSFSTAGASNNSQSTIIFRKVSSNLYSKAGDSNFGIDYSTGNLVAGDTYRVSAAIPVKPNTEYVLEGRVNSTSQGFAAYDANMVIIPYSVFTKATTGNKYGDTLNGVFNTGADIKFIRLVSYSSFNGTAIETQRDGIKLYERISAQSKIPYINNIDGNEFASSRILTREGVLKEPMLPENPADYCSSGLGTEERPYISLDGTGGLTQAMFNLEARAGKVRIPSARFNLTASPVVKRKNIHIEGDAWNYSNDPNGVYESPNGSKLRLMSAELAGLIFSGVANISGGRVSQIGVQGTIANSNTKGLFSIANAAKHTGANFPSARVDQFEMYRFNACGLSSGLSFTGGDIDACIFDRLNVDGCNVGIYFSPTNTYYTKFKDSIVADCPSQGMWVKKAVGGNDLQMLIIEGLVLVRNCGAMTAAQLSESEAASLLITGVVTSIIRGNQIDNTGVWWEYFTTGNGTKTIHTMVAAALIFSGSGSKIHDNIIGGATGNSAIIRGANNEVTNNKFAANNSLLIEGSSNIISSNTVSSSTPYSIEVKGNSNVISNCSVTKSIRIVGNNNRVINCFATPGSSVPVLVIIEAGATGTILQGFLQSEIQDNGTGTIVR